MIDWKLTRHHVSITIVTRACACLSTRCPDKKQKNCSAHAVVSKSKNNSRKVIWLVVSTNYKNTSQNGNLPQFSE